MGDYAPTPADAPSIEPDEAFWRNARVVTPSGKASIHLRVDNDVLAWFKAQGRGHLTRMNAVLRSYMEAHARKTRKDGA
ncbi:MAG: BrnA antitoxin family protein [Geminicoccaceae bacterium]|nr:BrnA antitoxin family protein [Geminicoccaceae bacterium]